MCVVSPAQPNIWFLETIGRYLETRARPATGQPSNQRSPLQRGPKANRRHRGPDLASFTGFRSTNTELRREPHFSRPTGARITSSRIVRSLYADQTKEVGNVDDAILVNERGELTEATIGNIVLELDGRRVTRRSHAGFRAALLEAGRIEEGILYPADLARATRIWMINSLREWVPCELR
jgi:branched-subunit amino acid aminotransferase/4-amino-4-deoxychorismate lyase